MAVTLGHNQHGKAETRMVRVTRDGDRHELKDLNVGVTLSGDLADVHLTGDNEVFHADDRPYGLIEAAVLDDDAPDPGPAWDPYPML